MALDLWFLKYILSLSYCLEFKGSSVDLSHDYFTIICFSMRLSYKLRSGGVRLKIKF